MKTNADFTPKLFLIILLISLIGYFPFVNKAIHVDSDMLVHMSRQILVDPLNPPLGDYGRNMAIHNRTKMPPTSVFYRCPHPPLLPYLFAPIAAFAGMNEWPFHVIMFLFFIASLWGVWYLFGFFFPQRLQILGLLIWALSPALLINAHNIMWDMPLAVWLIWSFNLFLYAQRAQRPKPLFVSGLLAGFGALTKMTIAPIFALIPFYYCLMRQWKKLLIWVLPASLLPGLWIIHNLLVFGQIQYLATDHLHPIWGDIRYRFERIVSYLGGGIFLPLWWYWLILNNKKRLVSFIPVALAMLVWSALLFFILKKPLIMAICYAVFSSAGLWILGKTLLSGWSTKNMNLQKHEGILISSFCLLYLIMMEFLPLASVRFTLPILPFVIMVGLDMVAELSEKVYKVFSISLILVGVIFSLSLSYADYVLCDSYRQLPQRLIKNGFVPEKTWYFGRLSYDYYLFHAGFRNLLTDKEKPALSHYVVKECIPGDYPIDKFFKDKQLIIRKVIDSPRFPLRTIGIFAGFYGHARLPYSIDFKHPQTQFIVYEIGEMKTGNQ